MILSGHPSVDKENNRMIQFFYFLSLAPYLKNQTRKNAVGRQTGVSLRVWDLCRR